MIKTITKRWTVILFISLFLNIFLGGLFIANKYFKDKNEKYASIFFSSQASKLSGSIDQMLRYLIFQILSEDGEKTSSKILRGDISTLKLF